MNVFIIGFTLYTLIWIGILIYITARARAVIKEAQKELRECEEEIIRQNEKITEIYNQSAKINTGNNHCDFINSCNILSDIASKGKSN